MKYYSEETVKGILEQIDSHYVKALEGLPSVDIPDSSWHTGTPTEGGWYLTKVTDVDKPYEVLKFENGKWSDYLDYDDVPEVVNDSFVHAYQEIEP